MVIPAIMIVVGPTRGVLRFTSGEADDPSNSMIAAAVCITLAWLFDLPRVAPFAGTSVPAVLSRLGCATIAAAVVAAGNLLQRKLASR
jgi:hypothetical protein